ncbi:pyridoxal phosphate-dependent aminotransferase [Megasphaera hominis]|jgi:aspartate aminotransferase|uniref:Aminotransferase n=1 Tax=Megasphaera hominis TaxID=159836 RepID=A0ABR6VK82_9FIRM|nr:pyridoxal phosphate-dependent aminotransferase [Megasphaera hominis]MBC3537693.1 pyridoxal phosphate-dependent aminotransferase [Megasphaera hominis]
MADKKMYELGAVRSKFSELFEYGQEQAKKIGAENVYDFSLGNPSIPAPDCVKEAIFDMYNTLSSKELHSYTNARGLLEVRQYLADYMNETYNAGVGADNFHITVSSSASLAVLIRALQEDTSDEFIVVAPFYPEYRVFIEPIGSKCVVVPPDTEHFQLSIEGVEQAITPHTRAIIINTPNNPSGAVYSEETIKELAALLTRKSAEIGHPIFLISDEPYREVIYDNLPILYIPHYYDNTIVTYSYSKSLSLPGERIGYILVPPAVDDWQYLMTAILGAARMYGYVCAPSTFQRVIAAVHGATGDISEYDKNRHLIYDNLTRMGYDCVYPSGAFYLFVKAPDGDSIQFMENAKKLNILIVAADEFACPGYARISYCVDSDMIVRSLPAFEKLLAMYK